MFVCSISFDDHPSSGYGFEFVFPNISATNYSLLRIPSHKKCTCSALDKAHNYPLPAERCPGPGTQRSRAAATLIKNFKLEFASHTARFCAVVVEIPSCVPSESAHTHEKVPRHVVLRFPKPEGFQPVCFVWYSFFPSCLYPLKILFSNCKTHRGTKTSPCRPGFRSSENWCAREEVGEEPENKKNKTKKITGKQDYTYLHSFGLQTLTTSIPDKSYLAWPDFVHWFVFLAAAVARSQGFRNVSRRR